MIRIEYRGRKDKLQIAGELFREFLDGDVLDVGCDLKELHTFVSGNYIGIDISGKPDIVVDLENGVPFKDQSFDCVVSFDTLEHLDDLHFVFDEMCRVSRRFVILGLTNIAEWRNRLSFLLFGRITGGKYGLPCKKPNDRHKWLFSLSDIVKFIHERGRYNGFSVYADYYGYYRYRRRVARVISWLGRSLCAIGIARNIFVYSYWAVLERRQG